MKLYTPFDLGPFTLPHRLVMAPMTRNRAGEANVPTASNATYYAQRASAGLILTAATQVAPLGQGYPKTPGIHTKAQVEGWRQVTETVHEAGGRIFLQLWHVGRISHSSYHDGARPVAPSPVRPAGKAMTAGGEQVPFETPRALETEEVAEVVQQYRRGAERAEEAGFDGVEIHAANGYLIDQFLRSGTNQRTDRYGGSAANRARFLLEVTDAVTELWSAERVGVRLSPLSAFNDMHDDDPAETFSHVAQALDAYGLAYLHLVEPEAPKPPHEASQGEVFERIRAVFTGSIMANGSYTRESAEAVLAEGYADLVSFGRAFLANPDLPHRLAHELPLNEPDRDTFYGGGREGYVDYPTWEELEAAEEASARAAA